MKNQTSCGGSAADHAALAKAQADIDAALVGVDGVHLKLSTLTVALARRVAALAGPLPDEGRKKLICGVQQILATNIDQSLADAPQIVTTDTIQ